MSPLARSLRRLLQRGVRSGRRAAYHTVPPRPSATLGFARITARNFSERARAVIPPSYSEKDQEVVDSVQLLLEKRIRPVVQQDGGDVAFLSYDPETGKFSMHFDPTDGVC
ncbi:NifU-like domain containing protein, putative [Babesia caballi]|uniref:NifU-like domain containing protein, putative n=1 Tax=Babesia caballi TaxID=5871 RepID=A0AAV4LMA2_BABCB|nr:NifU-like domain containing protein, putative [Babesia caballi]